MAEFLTKVFVKGIEEDIFDGECVAVVAIKFSAALGLSDMDPIGRLVTGSAEAGLFDKGFEQDGLIAIAGLPVLRQAPGGLGQDTGREVFGGDPRKDEETGVINDPMKVAEALFWGRKRSQSIERAGFLRAA